MWEGSLKLFVSHYFIDKKSAVNANIYTSYQQGKLVFHWIVFHVCSSSSLLKVLWFPYL